MLSLGRVNFNTLFSFLSFPLLFLLSFFNCCTCPLDITQTRKRTLFMLMPKFPCHAFKWESDQLDPDLLIRLKFLLGTINKMACWEVIWTDHGYRRSCEEEDSYLMKKIILIYSYFLSIYLSKTRSAYCCFLLK